MIKGGKSVGSGMGRGALVQTQSVGPRDIGREEHGGVEAVNSALELDGQSLLNAHVLYWQYYPPWVLQELCVRVGRK